MHYLFHMVAIKLFSQLNIFVFIQRETSSFLLIKNTFYAFYMYNLYYIMYIYSTTIK